MTAFQDGDKVLVEATVQPPVEAGEYGVRVAFRRPSTGPSYHRVDGSLLRPVPPEWAYVGNDEDGWPASCAKVTERGLEWRQWRDGEWRWTTECPAPRAQPGATLRAREPALLSVDGVSPEDVRKVIAAYEGAKS